MTQLRLTVLALTAFATLLGSALAQEGDEAIDALRQQWADLYNQEDIAGVADLYAEDAVFYPASGEVVEGREAIQESIQGNLDSGAVEITINSSGMEVLGDTAYDVGSYTFATAEGETAAQGNYMVILKQVDGEWRIHRHISNQVMPMQEPGEGEDADEG